MSFENIKQQIESINFTGSITIRSNEFIKEPISTAKNLIDLIESNKDNKGYEPYYNTLILILKEVKMSNKKIKIIEALKSRGFTGNDVEFDLFYWANDGWYLHCDQVQHVCIGYNYNHVLESTLKGENDQYLNTSINY